MCSELLSTFIITRVASATVFFNIPIRRKLGFTHRKEVRPTSHSLLWVQRRLGNFNLRCFPDFIAEIFHTFINLETSKFRQCINYPVAEFFLRLEYPIYFFLCLDICLEINANEVRINTLNSIVENVLNALMNRAKFLFFNNLLDCFLKIFTHQCLVLFFRSRLFELSHFLVGHAEQCHVFFIKLVFDVSVSRIVRPNNEGTIENKLF